MNGWIESLNGFSGALVLGWAWPLVWQSSLLAMVVWAFNCTLFRKASAQLRYALWALVLVRLVLPPTLDLPTGIRHWATPVMEQQVRTYVQPAPMEEIALAPVDLSEVTPLPPASPADLEMAEAHSESALRVWPQWTAWALLGWVLGALALTILLVVQLARYQKLLLRSLPAPEGVMAQKEELAGLLGVRWPVAVRVVEAQVSPALIGLARLRIVLPASALEQLDGPQLRAVLAHELAHVKRLDFLVNWVQVILGIAYFFHPVLWLVSRQMRKEREHACDDLSLVTLGLNRWGYAESLVQVAEAVSTDYRMAPVQVGITESKGHLNQRLRRVLDRTRVPVPRLTVFSAVLVMGFAALFGTWHETQAEAALPSARIHDEEAGVTTTAKAQEEGDWTSGKFSGPGIRPNATPPPMVDGLIIKLYGYLEGNEEKAVPVRRMVREGAPYWEQERDHALVSSRIPIDGFFVWLAHTDADGVQYFSAPMRFNMDGGFPSPDSSSTEPALAAGTAPAAYSIKTEASEQDGGRQLLSMRFALRRGDRLSGQLDEHAPRPVENG